MENNSINRSASMGGFSRALLLGASGSVLALALGATSAFANAATGDTASNSGTADIVVTAQRKEEKLSKVPVSVVAFGGEALKSRAITSEQDMTTLVPGLQVKNGQNSNQLSFSMRGQTLDPFSGTSPAVLTYLNEAPYNPGNTATSFFDLGSIQVLKGPQGTLFGRNATGGAVLYSTPMPGDDVSGFVILRGAQRDYGQVQGAVDVPFAPGKFVARIAFDVTKGNGYVQNVATGNTLGDKESQNLRGTFVFTPSDTIKNVTLIQYDKVAGTEGEGNLWNYYSGNAGGPQYINNGITSILNTNGSTLYNGLQQQYGTPANDTLVAGPGSFPGGILGYLAWSRANPYKSWQQFDLPHHAENIFITNTTEVKLGDDMKLKNIFSYMHGYADTPGNLAASPFGALQLFNEPGNQSGLSGAGGPGGEVFHSETYTDEVQIQGKALDSRLEYTAGLFYSHQVRNEIIPITIGNDNNVTGNNGGNPYADIDYAYRNTETSKAVYAQASYKITDQLTATLGSRYTWESLGINQNDGSLFTLLNGGTPPAPEHKNLQAPAWTFSLNYQIDPHNMVYFSQRGSFRSGNFNGTVAPAFNSFNNEYVKDFELGYKFNGHIADAPVQFNIAAYDVIVHNAQHALYAIVGGSPAGFTVNVPVALTRGVEVDANVGLTSWLDLSFNAAYTDSIYSNGLVNPANSGNIVLDTVPDSPKVSGSIAADIKFPIDEKDGKLDLRTDVYHQTHTFFSNTTSVTPGDELSGYTTIGMRLSWKDIEQTKVSAALYIRNVANKLYYISGYAMGAAGGYNTAYPGEPRTIGGELSVKF